jgi:hypothetical protein
MSDVKIISNTGLDSMTTTLAATITTAAMTTFIEPGTGTATINLKVNHQPAINLCKLLKLRLKHNHQQSNQSDFNNPKNRD